MVSAGWPDSTALFAASRVLPTPPAQEALSVGGTLALLLVLPLGHFHFLVPRRGRLTPHLLPPNPPAPHEDDRTGTERAV